MSVELERLAMEAAAVEAEDLAAAPAMPGQEPAPVVDPSQEWIDLARFGADLVLAPIPELKPEWTGERVEAFVKLPLETLSTAEIKAAARKIHEEAAA